MSSKRAMKQAQKQAFARHRSNITQSRFNQKKRNSAKKSKKNLVLVTHYVLISEILNYGPSSGEIVVSNRNLNIIGSLEINY